MAGIKPLVLACIVLVELSCSARIHRDVPQGRDSELIQSPSVNSESDQPASTPGESNRVESSPHVEESRIVSNSPIVSPSPAEPTPTPKESRDPLAPPAIQRTTVVIGNGYQLPIESFWLRYDPEDKLITSTLEFIVGQHRGEERIQKFALDQHFEALCVNNPWTGENLYLRSLWSRISHYSSRKEVTYVSSLRACGGDTIPNFADREAGALYSRVDKISKPQFQCKADLKPGTVFTLTEQAIGAKAPVARLESFYSEREAHEVAILSMIHLVQGPSNEPQFQYSDDRISILIDPYRPSRMGVSGRVIGSGLELSCRMEH